MSAAEVPVREWKRKDLLGLEELSPEEINLILETADSFREVLERPIKKVPALRGKTIANLFFEPSTRTQVSFDLAAKRLSADTTSIAARSSSLLKGETLLDTARNIEAMKVDAVVVRHSSAGVPHLLARHLSASVINAGDGCHEHPTQALLDIFTLRRRFGNLAGLRVAILGDIAHSRVARSNIWGLTKLGAQVVVVGPPTLIPPGIEAMGVEVSYDVDDVLGRVDVVNVLRIQKERQEGNLLPSLREYRAAYGLTLERMARAPRTLIVMHPGPVNRGVELDPAVADGPWSVILDQVTNGVAVRMAVLFLLVGERTREEAARTSGGELPGEGKGGEGQGRRAAGGES